MITVVDHFRLYMSRLYPSRIGLALLLVSVLLAASLTGERAASAQAITYTGQLLLGGTPVANGSYDFQFSLYTAATGGSQVNSTVSVSAVSVQSGVFYTEINLGNTSTGASLYLQTAYRPTGTTTYTTQSPRKLIPTTSYAQFATYAFSAHSLYSHPVSSNVPTTGQVLQWNGAVWLPTLLPAPPAYTAGAGLALAGDQFSIANGGVSTAMLANGSVTAPKLALPLVLSGSNAPSGSNTGGILVVTNTGGGDCIQGFDSDPNHSGVLGLNTNSSGGYGVYGSSVGAQGYGVVGLNTNGGGVQGVTTGSGVGVTGQSSSGYGVEGTNTASKVYGVLGGGSVPLDGSTTVAAVYGNDSGTNTGVLGVSEGNAVYGFNTVSRNSGILGTENYGVFGQSSIRGGGNAAGYFSSTGGGDGVDGEAISGVGILGNSSSDTGVVGQSGSDDGVYGINLGLGNYGTLGDVSGYGVYGNGGSNSSPGGYFTSQSGDGVQGVSSTTNRSGVYGTNTGSGGYAAYFSGNVTVTGTLTGGAKDFRIDDPLDPAHKYLSHASVESDQMEDVYHGHVLLRADGTATVEMPTWFTALNKDCEYTLTCVGGYAPVYIAAELGDDTDTFQIAGGKPGLKVSWQVTGIRRDAYAVAHPLQVEQDKPKSEQGLYQNPEAFGLPASQGVGTPERQR